MQRAGGAMHRVDSQRGSVFAGVTTPAVPVRRPLGTIDVPSLPLASAGSPRVSPLPANIAGVVASLKTGSPRYASLNVAVPTTQTISSQSPVENSIANQLSIQTPTAKPAAIRRIVSSPFQKVSSPRVAGTATGAFTPQAAQASYSPTTISGVARTPLPVGKSTSLPVGQSSPRPLTAFHMPASESTRPSVSSGIVRMDSARGSCGLIRMDSVKGPVFATATTMRASNGVPKLPMHRVNSSQVPRLAWSSRCSGSAAPNVSQVMSGTLTRERSATDTTVSQSARASTVRSSLRFDT
eukprot:TRINITY_DN23662_c0_g1_i1.p1 TRINITY_DN23662_c0_g1~~TRINITY_DN23662_c0_g1_i1.p1  ORF type:complete len:296 (-),score=23.56 TRINITY_DN23662_c0_g1_i1:237-1124(-)